MIEDLFQSESFYQRQRGHALRGIARDSAGEQLVWQQNRFNMSADLRQETRGPRFSGFAEKDSAKFQSTADRLFNDPKTFNGALAGRG